MKLNHLNLTVTNVPETRDFLVKYFALEPKGKGNDKITLLLDDNGLVLTLIKVQSGNDVTYPESFHIGFIQESEAKVDEINQRLKNDGYEVDPPAKMHGSWTFYFRAPGGFTIEVLS